MYGNFVGGSLSGGSILTLDGTGFHPNRAFNVTIGDYECPSILALDLFADFVYSTSFIITVNGTKYIGIEAVQLLETSHTVFVCVTSPILESLPSTSEVPVPVPAPIPAPVPVPGDDGERSIPIPSPGVRFLCVVSACTHRGACQQIGDVFKGQLSRLNQCKRGKLYWTRSHTCC